jgi:hypothetical protein
MPETNTPTPITEPAHGLRPNGRHAGGQFALLAPKTHEQIAGRDVLIGHRVDGKWVAETRDDNMKSGRRQWMGADHDNLVARIEHDLATGAPSRIGRGKDQPVKAVPAPALNDVPTFAAERVHEGGLAVAEAIRTNGHAADWHAVAVDPGDFPLAVSLDGLEAATAPAIAALEAAGKGDAAALVRAELARTPAEDELLRLWRQVRGRE